MQGRRGSPTRVPLCPAHRLCRKGRRLYDPVSHALRRPGTHTPPPPGTRGHKAGIAEAGEGGRHSNQQAPFVAPSIAIDRRQTGLHFRVSISAVPGVAGRSLAGGGGMGPKNFLPIGGPGCGPADRGRVPNRTVESPCPRASVAQRAREAAPGSGLPGPDLSSAISRTLGSPAGGQPSPSAQQRRRRRLSGARLCRSGGRWVAGLGL